jgi:uncharacterized membrane protein affecting hemolysin expression
LAQVKQDKTSNKAPQKSSKVSFRFSLTFGLFIILAMCCFWLINTYTTQNLQRSHTDNLGQTLANQTAGQMTEFLLANDMISMNVILSSLTQNSAVARVEVINVSGAVIAMSTSTESGPKPIVPLPFSLNLLAAQYSAPIELANSIAGTVRLTLDLSHIETGLVNSLVLNSIAAILLAAVGALLINTYFQYLVTFPANLLAFALSNIRKGEIEICPEPKNSNELSAAIRQFNATAGFLAQNTFLSNFGTRSPQIDGETFTFEPGMEDVVLLNIKMSNFQFLASTLSESAKVSLLNKFYFYAGKVSQLYSGQVTYCSDGEVLVNFAGNVLEAEQAFFAICAGQLFLQLVSDIGDVEGKTTGAKFQLAVHGGQAVGGLYSPITQKKTNLTGKTLDLCRAICNDCPDNNLLISQRCFEQAGAATRVEGQEFTVVDDDEQIIAYISSLAMSEFQTLLERQAIQLVSIYSE